jgi:hypothetical protein
LWWPIVSLVAKNPWNHDTDKMLAFTRLALFALATLSAASDLTADKKKAIVGHGRKGHWKIPGHGMDPPPSSGNATFRQLIDHKNPGLGTFDQTYWYVPSSGVRVGEHSMTGSREETHC